MRSKLLALALCACAAAQAQTAITALTSFWKNDYDAAAGVIYDSKGTAHGRTVGGTINSAVIGGVGLQNGVSVSASDVNTTAGQPFTFAAWVLHSSTNAILSRYEGVTGQQMWTLRFNATPGRLELVQLGGNVLMSGGNIATTTLTLVWFAYDGTQIKLAVNGAAWQNFTPGASFHNNHPTRPLDIAHNNRAAKGARVGYTMFWRGYIPTDVERAEILAAGADAPTYFGVNGYVNPTPSISFTKTHDAWLTDASVPGQEGLYFLRPFATAGTSVSGNGAYVWFRSTDHSPAAGSIWRGYSNSPSVAPSSWTKVLPDGTYGGVAYTQMETPHIVWNPDTSLWHVYAHGIVTGSSGPVVQRTLVWTSSDLATFTYSGQAFPTITGRNHTGYAYVERLGTGNWVANTSAVDGSVAAPNGPKNATWSSTDGLTWTLVSQDATSTDSVFSNKQYPYFVPYRPQRVNNGAIQLAIFHYMDTATAPFVGSWPYRNSGIGTAQDVRFVQIGSTVYAYVKPGGGQASQIDIWQATLPGAAVTYTHHRTVCAGGCTDTSLAAALTAAVAAQDGVCKTATITLEAGATTTGPIVIPEGTTSCSAELIIRSSRVRDIGNRRVTTADHALMHQIISPGISQAAVEVPLGVKGLAFEGIRFSRNLTETADNYGIVRVGDIGYGTQRISTLVDGLRFTRCIVDNPSNINGAIRGITLRGAKRVLVEHSYIHQMHVIGSDAQAIWLDMCIRCDFTNNYLAGAAENVLLGGAANTGGSQYYIAHPQNALRFTGNHFHKPVEWMLLYDSADPGVNTPAQGCREGSKWRNNTSGNWFTCTGNTWVPGGTGGPLPTVVKNLFELKDGRWVTLRGNLLDESWASGQQGQGLFVNNTGERMYTVTNLTFEANRVKNVLNYWSHRQYPDSALNFFPLTRLTFRHNLVENYAPPGYAIGYGSPRGIGIHGVVDMRFENNTVQSHPQTALRSVMLLQTGRGTFDYPATQPYASGYFSLSKNILGPKRNWPATPAYLPLDSWSSYTFNDGYCTIDDPSLFTRPTAIDISIGVHVGSGITQGPCPSPSSSSPTFPSSVQIAASQADVLNPDFTAKAPYEGMGANIPLVNAATAGAESGTPNPFLAMQIRSASATSPTTARIIYTSVTAGACTVVVTGPGGSSVTESGTGRDREAIATGLTTKSRYTATVTCSGYPSISKEFIQ